MAASTQTYQEMFMPTPEGFVNFWNSARQSIHEEGIIDFVAKLSPWIAPLPSAWFVHDATVRHLAAGSALAWIIAIVIETLGLTTTHTALGMHAWNKAHAGQPEKRAPFALSVVLAVVYVIATLMLISVLEVAPNLQHYAPAMFPLLAVVGAVNLALRSHHNTMVREERTDKHEDKQRQREIEDEERAQRLEEKRLRAMAKYGLTVNQGVNSGVNLTVKTDSVTPEKSKIDIKIDNRRSIIFDAYQKNPSIKIVELMTLVGASRNTVKEDMRALGILARTDEQGG
jgi:hypothetical protein